jgi:hypothetical protein
MVASPFFGGRSLMAILNQEFSAPPEFLRIRDGYEIFEGALQRELYGPYFSLVLYLIPIQLASSKPLVQEMLP